MYESFSVKMALDIGFQILKCIFESIFNIENKKVVVVFERFNHSNFLIATWGL